jgi:hypothetical protein
MGNCSPRMMNWIADEAMRHVGLQRCCSLMSDWLCRTVQSVGQFDGKGVHAGECRHGRSSAGEENARVCGIVTRAVS